MNYVTGVILVSLAMAIIVGLVHQAWTYARGMQIISRRQFILRLTTGFLLLLTIALIFYTVLARISNPVTALTLWGLLTLLPLVVIILAWLDLRELARTRHQRQAELYRDLAELQRDLRSAQAPQPGKSPEDE